MKDCESCKHFKLEKEENEFIEGYFEVPICKLKNTELKSSEVAKTCKDFKRKE